MQRFGAIHILVNNAGSVPSMQFTEVDDALWHQMLEGKLLSYIRVTPEIVPHMRKAGGEESSISRAVAEGSRPPRGWLSV
jgi:NAD(P)-dependent dehydrogenase (short-subunit alcohol dehydrogenase family)